MEELIELFEKTENIRHKREIESNLEFFDPPRGNNYFKEYHEQFLKKVDKHEFGKTTKTGENLDAIKLYGISIDEASVIYMYTHHHIYENLNYNLRSNFENIDPDLSKYAELLNNALSKLPSINNSIIYRDIRHPRNGVEVCLNYYASKINENILFNDFLSCHTDNKKISDDETDFQFIITTSDDSNAKDIQQITLVQIEKEVLFKNCTKFKITKVDKDKNEVFMIEV